MEVRNRDLTYHTRDGAFTERRSLKTLESQLQAQGFQRCSGSFLVNLAWCSGLSKDEVLVDGARLRISRGMRQEFLARLSEFLPNRPFGSNENTEGGERG